eukprot:6821337-Pyramimonas_sp.AAC.4
MSNARHVARGRGNVGHLGGLPTFRLGVPSLRWQGSGQRLLTGSLQKILHGLGCEPTNCAHLVPRRPGEGARAAIARYGSCTSAGTTHGTSSRAGTGTL